MNENPTTVDRRPKIKPSKPLRNRKIRPLDSSGERERFSRTRRVRNKLTFSRALSRAAPTADSFLLNRQARRLGSREVASSKRMEPMKLCAPLHPRNLSTGCRFELPEMNLLARLCSDMRRASRSYPGGSSSGSFATTRRQPARLACPAE